MSDWLFQLIMQHLKLDDGFEYTKKNLPRMSLTLEWLVGWFGSDCCLRDEGRGGGTRRACSSRNWRRRRSAAGRARAQDGDDNVLTGTQTDWINIVRRWLEVVYGWLRHFQPDLLELSLLLIMSPADAQSNQFVPYVTWIKSFIDNLNRTVPILQNATQALFTCGLNCNTRLIFCNATAVWTVRSHLSDFFR